MMKLTILISMLAGVAVSGKLAVQVETTFEKGARERKHFDTYNIVKLVTNWHLYPICSTAHESLRGNQIELFVSSNNLFI